MGNLTKSGGGGSWTCEASDPEPGFIWGGGAYSGEEGLFLP